MSNPFQPPLQPPQQQQQLRDRDRLVRLALFPVDTVAMGAYSRPRADMTRSVVTETIGYLIGTGLVTVTPADQLPEYVSLETPPHLRSAIPAGTLD
jgi:hypothetical protein